MDGHDLKKKFRWWSKWARIDTSAQNVRGGPSVGRTALTSNKSKRWSKCWPDGHDLEKKVRSSTDRHDLELKV